MATPPDFSVGQVLTAAQMNAVGLWLIKTKTIGSAEASVTVAGAFSADYKNYKIIVSGGSGSTTAELQLRLANTAAYIGSYLYGDYGSGTVGNLPYTNQTSWLYAGHTSTLMTMMNVDVFMPYETTRTFMHGHRSAIVVPGTQGIVGGYLNNTTSYTDFTIIPSAGTLTGGTIYVYGYRD